MESPKDVHHPLSPARWLERGRIRRHFAGSIAPAAERRMRQHLADCSDCRAYYEERLLLSQLDPGGKSAFDRIGIGLGVLQAEEQRARLPLLAFASAAAVLLLVLGTGRLTGPGELEPAPEPAASEFVARGTLPSSSDASVSVYRHRAGGSELVSTSIERSDELSFAYTNRAGFRYLLVFAVDERGSVFWYYPAWSDASATPSALPITTSTALVELPEAIRHELGGKQLRLLSIFTNQPLTVRQVEERLNSLGASHEGPLFEGTLQQERALEVR